MSNKFLYNYKTSNLLIAKFLIKLSNFYNFYTFFKRTNIYILKIKFLFLIF